jgi:glycerol-3-phosphate O-acyltransferase
MADRWLLPFTQRIDMRTIEYVVHLAASSGATLVAASLISVPDKPPNKGARLEDIQQSKDFLEAVQWKAARYQTQTERYEIFTADVFQSIALLVHDLHCDSIVLATDEEKAFLMGAHEIAHLLVQPPASLVLIRFPAKKAHTTPQGAGFDSWMRRLQRWKQRNNARQASDGAEAEEPLWVRTEEYHRG